MNWRFYLLFVVVLLLMSPQRLPAPIVEETPAATPVEPEEPKASRGAKPKVKSSTNETSPEPQSRSARSQVTTGPKFPGTWSGTLPFGLAGDLHLILVVNNEGNSVTESGGLAGTIHLKATNDGKTVTWRSGILSEIGWTLTPNSDGATAIVTAKGALVGSPSAVFRKGPGSATSATSSSKATRSAPQAMTPITSTREADVPIAKPDPNRPGFVHNPFDPMAVRRLDVRGKAAGTKVKDPVSGKFFIVP